MSRRTQIRRLLGLTALVLAAAVAGSTLTAAAGGGRFTDVGAEHPFAEDIEFVAETGIAGGFTDGTYRPGEPVSRQAMAAFLHRAQTYHVAFGSHSAISSASISAIATCPAGHVPISGGGMYQGPGRAYVSATGPDIDDNGWLTKFTREGGTLASHSMTAWAVCVRGELVSGEAAD